MYRLLDWLFEPEVSCQKQEGIQGGEKQATSEFIKDNIVFSHIAAFGAVRP